MIAIKHTGNFILTGNYLPNFEPLYREDVKNLTEEFSIPNLFDRPSTIDDFFGINELQIPLEKSEVPAALKEHIMSEVDATFTEEAAEQVKNIGFDFYLAAHREDNNKEGFLQSVIDAVTKDGRWDMTVTVYLTKEEYRMLGAKLNGARKYFETDRTNRDYLFACSDHSEEITLGDKTYTVKIPALTAEIEQKIINAVGTEIKVENSAKSIESILSHDPIVPDDVLSRINRLEYSDMLETLEGDLEHYCMNLGVEEMAKINDISDPDAKEDIYYPLAEKYGFNEWYYYITLDEWKKRLLEVAAMKRGNA